ncbi:MAG: Flp family type IVb pilin [Pseudomonadota bacterium]
MKNKIDTFLKDESAATAIEYALIAGGIALAIITAVNSLGNNLQNQYNTIANSLP